MADKPTPPDDEARRKKRAAPTIDLTATEVPPPQASAPEPRASEPEPPPVAANPESNDAGGNAGHWLPANIRGPALAGGIAGAALMSVVLFALWLSGLVPIRYAGSTAMRARVTGLEMQMHDLQNRPAGAADTKSIGTLTERIAKMEAALAKLPASDPGVAERLATADNAMKSLGVALAALNKRSDDIAGNAAQASARAEAAEKAIAELRTSMQTVAKDATAGISSAALEPLQKRIGDLEQSAKLARDDIAKTAATDNAARLALSAAALREAVLSGAPFAGLLAQAKSLGTDDKTLAPLAPFAEAGVPNSQMLAQELHSLLPAMLKISGAQAPAGGFLEKLQANAGRLVRIRPVDAPAGNDAPAVLARLEIDAARADIEAALSDLSKLPAATRAPAVTWIAKVQLRQAALTAAKKFASDTARALGPQAGAQ